MSKSSKQTAVSSETFNIISLPYKWFLKAKRVKLWANPQFPSFASHQIGAFFTNQTLQRLKIIRVNLKVEKLI